MQTINSLPIRPSKLNRRLIHLVVSGALLFAFQATSKGITVFVDYTHDDTNFFAAGSAERQVFEAAATAVGDLFIDELAAIEPDSSYSPPGSIGFPAPGNSWQASFTDPSNTTVTLTEDFLTVPEDTLIVFAGADDFSGPQLGFGGIGDHQEFGSNAFRADVANRGEPGQASTWGGFVSVDSQGTAWNTSIDGSTLAPGEFHLYSVLLHELAHVLGFGTHDVFRDQTSNDEFTGPIAMAEFGGPVPLEPLDNEHFGPGLVSTVYATDTAQEPSLSAQLNPAEVRLLTDLDVALLQDLGWEPAPVPEPNSALLVAAAAGALTLRRRPRNK